MRGVIEQETWFYFVFGTLFIVFGAAALLMATVGLYGVLAFSVSRRIKEMGIRMALGASARDVISLIMRQGGKQLAVGLSIGLLLAFALTRVIGLLIFEVSPQDPPVFAVVMLVIAAVGLLASFIPARRATAVDPMVALRYE
jgi:ABC-type antimicrobial peptide transport system permease subunit